MEKLIELLNDWEEKEFNGKRSRNIWKLINKKYEILFNRVLWFIERLVYNNKIDTSKIEDFKAETSDRFLYADTNNATLVDSLLMLLAIQDRPLDFLISILK